MTKKIMTIIGPIAIGKTAIAIEFAMQLKREVVGQVHRYNGALCKCKYHYCSLGK